MANYETIEQVVEGSPVVMIRRHVSTTNPPAGAVPMGSTAWPNVVLADGEGGTYSSPSQYAVLDGGAYRLPTEQELADMEAAISAVAQAAQLEKLATANEAFGAMVEELRTCLVELGYDLPCDSATVTAELLQRSRAGELTAEQEQAKGDLADLYIMLSGKGVDDDTIAAVWAYRVTT